MHTYTRTHARSYTCTHTRTYTYTHTRTYTHTYTHGWETGDVRDIICYWLARLSGASVVWPASCSKDYSRGWMSRASATKRSNFAISRAARSSSVDMVMRAQRRSELIWLLIAAELDFGGHRQHASAKAVAANGRSRSTWASGVARCRTCPEGSI